MFFIGWEMQYDKNDRSYGQVDIGSFITSPAGCSGEISNHPGDSALLQPRFGALQLLAFPKAKVTFEREEISDHRWDLWKYNRAADGDCENCVRSHGAYSEGD